MPKIYPKADRMKLHSINLKKLKNFLSEQGYEFIRDGGFTPTSMPFEYSNYLFYKNFQTGYDVRIGYDLTFNHIFEICYATKDIGYWIDVVPNFSKKEWRRVSDWYQEENGKFIKIKQ